MTQLPAVANTMPDLQAEIPAKNQMVTKDMPDTSGFRDVLNEASTPHSEPEVPREPPAPGAELRPGASDEGAELLPSGGNASPLEETALQKLAVPGVPVLAVSGTVTSDGPAHVAPPAHATRGPGMALTGGASTSVSLAAVLDVRGANGGAPQSPLAAAVRSALSTLEAGSSTGPAAFLDTPTPGLPGRNLVDVQHRLMEVMRPVEGGLLQNPATAHTTGPTVSEPALGTVSSSSTLITGVSPSGIPADNLGLRPQHAALSATVGTPEFTHEVSNRIMWLARHDGGAARLELSPPELGPINVKVTVQGDHAQIVLNAQHALTKEALESSAERLREALAEEGFTQVDVDVGEQEQEQERSLAGDGGSAEEMAPEDPAVIGQGTLRASSVHRGLVDRYV